MEVVLDDVKRSPVVTEIGSRDVPRNLRGKRRTRCKMPSGNGRKSASRTTAKLKREGIGVPLFKRDHHDLRSLIIEHKEETPPLSTPLINEVLSGRHIVDKGE